MKVAVIGSRNLKVKNIGQYLPAGTDCIISGGAAGVDACAAVYAKRARITLKEILPDYSAFGRRAPLVRNDAIIAAADTVIAFWDQKSHGTEYVIAQCERLGKPIEVYIPDPAVKHGFIPIPRHTQLKFSF